MSDKDKIAALEAIIAEQQKELAELREVLAGIERRHRSIVRFHFNSSGPCMCKDCNAVRAALIDQPSGAD